ncbi:MAG TPA: glycosyltransferase family 2 protein [Candidatus Sulfotelmatobacter sp.]|nr:glycosyltransferase family 2 protein [Candidatus Sulfotelmatobacter sp.]
MKPLVSILIPAYNAESWIADCLRCATDQTWPNKEIIVVDDGSKDRTLAIARQFESETVKVFTQKNQGASATRNNAFALCHGDYVQWLDADDLMAPDKTSKQMEAVEQGCGKRILISGAWGHFMHRPDRALFRPSALWQDLSRAEWLMRKMEHNTYMQTATWLVSRELAEQAGPWDTRLLGDDDGEFFCRVLLASEGTRFVPDAKVYYREAGTGSLSYIGFSNRKLEAQWVSMKLHIKYLLSLQDDERARKACITYIQNWMTFFYPERMDIFQEAREVAESLGGELAPPPLSWKYSWIDKLFGRRLAKRAQVLLPRIKWSVIRGWDKALVQVQGSKIPGA